MLENFNMNMNEKTVIRTSEQEWQNSPSNLVLRIPLEREQRESGHTTSIVQYHAGACFSAHGHPLGEEIFVLEGVFSDEHGDYPKGSYLRNPPGGLHSPFSKNGCKIFVKLNQFNPHHKKIVNCNTLSEKWSKGYGNLEVMPLHQFQGESTALVKWPKGERFILHQHFGGEEILVLKGVFKDEHGSYPEGTWIRAPHLSSHHPWVEEETVILVKTGHLN